MDLNNLSIDELYDVSLLALRNTAVSFTKLIITPANFKDILVSSKLFGYAIHKFCAATELKFEGKISPGSIESLAHILMSIDIELFVKDYEAYPPDKQKSSLTQMTDNYNLMGEKIISYVDKLRDLTKNFSPLFSSPEGSPGPTLH